MIQKPYFSLFDYVRLFGAYGVFLFHLFYGWYANWGWPTWLPMDNDQNLTPMGILLEKMIHNIAYIVDVFFLLSGFLLVFMLTREKEKAGDVRLKSYYLKRALRILPLVFVLWLAMPLLHLFLDEPLPKNIWLHLVGMSNLEIIRHGFSSSATNHLWSVCIEIHFYLFIPLVIKYFDVNGQKWILWSALAVSVLFRLFNLQGDQVWFTLYMHTLSRMDALIIGCLGAIYLHHQEIRFIPGRFLAWGSGLWLLLLFTQDVYVAYDGFLGGVAKKYLYHLPTALILWRLLYLKPREKDSWLQRRLAYLGKASYGIYMFNPVVIGVCVKLFYMTNWHNGWFFFFSTHLVLFILVPLSFEKFEKPILRLMESKPASSG
jgi:peptidoglycan/LPS O-acetylase OafA/YrhL